jgi:hypothetical protein
MASTPYFNSIVGEHKVRPYGYSFHDDRKPQEYLRASEKMFYPKMHPSFTSSLNELRLKNTRHSSAMPFGFLLLDRPNPTQIRAPFRT